VAIGWGLTALRRHEQSFGETGRRNTQAVQPFGSTIESEPELVGRLKALSRILGERALDGLAEKQRQAWVELVGRDRRLLQMGVHDLVGRRARKR